MSVAAAVLMELARPERFELPTNRFEAGYSIQLSYGRSALVYPVRSVQREPVRWNCLIFDQAWVLIAETVVPPPFWALFRRWAFAMTRHSVVKQVRSISAPGC